MDFYGIRILAKVSFIFITIHAFDKRTDGFTIAKTAMLQCRAVKMELQNLGVLLLKRGEKLSVFGGFTSLRHRDL